MDTDQQLAQLSADALRACTGSVTVTTIVDRCEPDGSLTILATAVSE